MNIKEESEYKIVDSINSDIDYLINELNECSNQDYFDINYLEDIKEKIEKDLENYENSYSKNIPSDLAIGNIIRITIVDGVSFSRNEYYKITEISDLDIKYDYIEVEVGDFARNISKEYKERMSISEFMKKYKKFHHKLSDINEWMELDRYLMSIPFKK